MQEVDFCISRAKCVKMRMLSDGYVAGDYNKPRVLQERWLMEYLVTNPRCS
jgi:hypothetical protein